ncbi:Swt1 family HEPN domain-containing protein [Myxosarcina sp. GI1(2024)]
MAITNKERVGRALDTLKEGLYPFIEREMRSVYRDKWVLAATSSIPDNYSTKKKVDEILQEDISALFILMCDKWQDVFKKTLGHSDRSLVSELRETRNDWAHGRNFSTDDTYRALDSIARLLSAISSPQADAVEKQKQELLRLRFEEQARWEKRKASNIAIESNPQGGLKPWREIVTPHDDVASGRFQQAEFAADLWQVYLDDKNCADEYRDPTEFFRRTYLTEGLKNLLVNALIRLSGRGGDPVIELQTNFGGGKTHAMLALYHLCLGVSAQDLPGSEAIFTESGIDNPPPNVNTVVIVGQKISPGIPHEKNDGTIVRTLWGEIAYQLGGKEGFEMVADADRTSTNPGDKLKELFNRYAPCLILIDEWVAYARQLHEVSDLPAGSFDTHFTFVQTLSESAKNADQTLLVVSIPASDIEKGGERGHEATERLKNAIGRVESPWRPATAEESFHIVRRRLFKDIIDPTLFTARDTVIRTFSQMYRDQKTEFPAECREKDFERRMKDAYPIHPELFERLYSDWSSLDKFQRTRGVLRLMAKVISYLWQENDKNLMILPANVPMADSQVQSELTRYLEDNWLPIIDKDVDGTNSLPVYLDGQNSNLGRYSACRRVTRTIYMGSAPLQKAANKGVDIRRIKLGCTQPGENVATFGDALRRLTNQATYFYVDNSERYWIDTQPNVTRTAIDRATQVREDQTWDEIIKRLKKERATGDFAGIHIAPSSSSDISDEETMGVRLVLLHPNLTHSTKAQNSEALVEAKQILEQKDTAPRYCKNLLVFLAPDQNKKENLFQWVNQYLAWESIVEDKEVLNLNPFQNKQAAAKLNDADNTVKMLLQDAYQWLLVPDQPEPTGEVEWEEYRLQGRDSSVLQASRKLVHEEHLILTYAASLLANQILDKYIWKNSNHINLKTLWKYFTNYLYLPRLKNEQVLIEAISEGVGNLLWQENFAYATGGYDESKQKYIGLEVGERIIPTMGSSSLLVKPDVAQQQIAIEQTPPSPPPIIKPPIVDPPIIDPPIINSPAPKKKHRFYGSVELDSERLNRDASQIADEVLQHLTSLVGANVKVTLEIEARVENGIPDNVIRTVNENCRTLKFKSQEFEEE